MYKYLFPVSTERCDRSFVSVLIQRSTSAECVVQAAIRASTLINSLKLFRLSVDFEMSSNGRCKVDKSGPTSAWISLRFASFSNLINSTEFKYHSSASNLRPKTSRSEPSNSFRTSKTLFSARREGLDVNISIDFKYVLPSGPVDDWLANLFSKPQVMPHNPCQLTNLSWRWYGISWKSLSVEQITINTEIWLYTYRK